MSGGHFYYQQHNILNIADDIEGIIRSNGIGDVDQWGDKIGTNFSDATIDEFKKAHMQLQLAYVYVRRIDWLMSGDDAEETFHERLAEDLERLKQNEIV